MDHKVAHHQQPLARGPAMVPISHAATESTWVDCFRPAPGGCCQLEHVVDELVSTDVTTEEHALGHLQGEIAIHPAVNHLLVEAFIVKQVITDEVDGVAQPRSVFRAE